MAERRCYSAQVEMAELSRSITATALRTITTCECSEDDGTRTRNIRIDSPVL